MTMTCKRSFILAALLMSGCATTSIVSSPSTVQAAKIQAPDIVGRWELVGIDGVRITSGKVILVFEADGDFRQQVSCNLRHGRYRIAGGVLSLSGVRVTERGCDPFEHEALIDQASRFDPWTVSAEGRNGLVLEGRHRLHLIRYSVPPGPGAWGASEPR